MTFVSAAKSAMESLGAHRLRSGLALLGIAIGVAAEIATVAIGTGASERVQEQISSIGSNLILVIPGSLTQSGLRLGTGNAATLTEQDAAMMPIECPAVSIAAPTVRGASQVVFGNANWGTSIQGVTPDYLTVRQLTLSSGEAFTQQDLDAAAKVALLGQTVVTNLFGASDPIGQQIRIGNVPIRVAGVLSPKGQSPTGQDQDDVVLVPISTAKKRLLGNRTPNAAAVGSILVQAKDPALVSAAEMQVREMLRQRHRLQDGQEDDFSIRNLEEVFRAQEASANSMAWLLAGVAAVSLLVGGIGIMNIMLIAVSERTREIGIRRAIGARAKDVLSQFLIEAGTLALLGGLAGTALGAVIAIAVAKFAEWNTRVSPETILISCAVAASVGVIFGYYPARRASSLNPTEALRYE